MLRAISRSPLIVKRILGLYEMIKKGEIEVDSIADIAHIDDTEALRNKKRNNAKQCLARVGRVYRQLAGVQDKLTHTPKRNVHIVRRLQYKSKRLIIKLSSAIQIVPFQQGRWDDFTNELQRVQGNLESIS